MSITAGFARRPGALLGSSCSLSELAAPSQGLLALSSKVQSSLRNKEPMRPIRPSRQASHRQYVTGLKPTLPPPIPFFSVFAFYKYEHTHSDTHIYKIQLHRLFSLLSLSAPSSALHSGIPLHLHFSPPPCTFPSPLVVVLFFCFPLLISMVTVCFPGIMAAGGFGGVKADGWLSHK